MNEDVLLLGWGNRMVGGAIGWWVGHSGRGGALAWVVISGTYKVSAML